MRVYEQEKYMNEFIVSSDSVYYENICALSEKYIYQKQYLVIALYMIRYSYKGHTILEKKHQNL